MSISSIALSCIAEEKAAADPDYRQELQRNGKPLLSQARKLTDLELLEKLQRVGIELDKASYAEIAEHAMSALEISQTAVTADVRARFKSPFDEDWVWFALTILWERWFPQWPNLEKLDDCIQSGYKVLKINLAGACEQWLKAWEDFLVLYDMGSFKSISDFDEVFGGTQFVSNWVNDLEFELGNAARQDPRWHEGRIQFCNKFLRTFHREDELTIQNMRVALAEATFGMSNGARGDALYEQWLKDDPQWGWGWIGWADCYFLLGADANRNPQRAEELLKQGLAVPNVRDQEDLLERLADLCREQGRRAEAEQFQAQSEAMRRSPHFSERPALIELIPPPNATLMLRGKHAQISEPTITPRLPKVGRNDPCPCGSGKKYKKCCLAKDEARGREAAKGAASPSAPA